MILKYRPEKHYDPPRKTLLVCAIVSVWKNPDFPKKIDIINTQKSNRFGRNILGGNLNILLIKFCGGCPKGLNVHLTGIYFTKNWY